MYAVFTKALGVTLDSLAIWFFCCVIAVFAVPYIADRIIFYLPKLIVFSRKKEVYARSIYMTLFEVCLWTIMIFGIYAYLSASHPTLFELVTTSVPALIAWGMGIINGIFRVLYYDQIVKRAFYYEAYMRYITPEALHEYQKFIEDLDNLYIDDLDVLLLRALPYMHRQAALRKQREVKGSSAK